MIEIFRQCLYCIENVAIVLKLSRNYAGMVMFPWQQPHKHLVDMSSFTLFNICRPLTFISCTIVIYFHLVYTFYKQSLFVVCKYRVS